jgi:hypothetical protein
MFVYLFIYFKKLIIKLLKYILFVLFIILWAINILLKKLKIQKMYTSYQFDIKKRHKLLLDFYKKNNNTIEVVRFKLINKELEEKLIT